MSNYNSLKTTIDANIKQNGRQEITGQILNSVLNQMVTTLGAGYQFAGVATLDPATDPGTPDAKVFYIANGKGTYTNFGGLEVTEDDVVVLYWDSSWHKVSTGIASNEKLSELEEEVNGSNSEVTETIEASTIFESYAIRADGQGLYGTSTSSIAMYKVTSGKEYHIAVPMTDNSFYQVVSYFNEESLPSHPSFINTGNTELIPGAVGNSKQNSFDVVPAETNHYIMVTYVKSGGTPVVTTQSVITIEGNVVKTTPQNFSEFKKTIARQNICALGEDSLQEINNQLYVEKTKVIDWVNNLMAESGFFRTRTNKRCTLPIPLNAGESVTITTTGDGSYLMTPIVRVSGADAKVSNSYPNTSIVRQNGSASSTYTYTATENIYISLCGDMTCVVTFANLDKESRFDVISRELGVKSPLLKGKSIMFFGDSLTAASTPNVIGFAKLIADMASLPYRAFVYDSADGSEEDVPVDYPCITNYAKDGTCNRNKSDRTDSVLQRVKRHVLEDTNVDYILFECCVNDGASANFNKGQISPSYTDTFDVETSIGAIEETLRYLTTLGKPLKIGAFIPWQNSWLNFDFFNAYEDVFKKWGVPLLSLRYTAGFDMQHCTAHSRLYSLSSDSYATWDATTIYNLDDKVKYGGSLYKCLADGVVGIPPTDETKWMQTSSSASDGSHLNNLGHQVVVGKILSFIENL